MTRTFLIWIVRLEICIINGINMALHSQCGKRNVVAKILYRLELVSDDWSCGLFRSSLKQASYNLAILQRP